MKEKLVMIAKLGLGYKVEDLKAVFDKVADPVNWKNPIEAMVPGELVKITLVAIEFYTGTKGEVKIGNLNMAKTLGYIPYVITAVGYQNGPCGDN